MIFKGLVEINKPKALVAKLFADPQYLKEYQDGFQSKTLFTGEIGQNGAESKMFFKHGKREMELKETITLNKLPDTFEALYEHKHMDNTMKCKFTALDKNRTLYEYEFEYIRVSWLMPKLMFLLFPSMFKKQGDKWMQQFKVFVEKQ